MNDPITDIVNESGMSIIRGDMLYYIERGLDVDKDDMLECWAMRSANRKTGITEVNRYPIELSPRDLMNAIFPADEWRQFFITPRTWFVSYIG